MIYSKTCEYGIRALSYLASKPALERTRIPEISRKTGVPGPYIAKVFQNLVAAGILQSSRGSKGGFSFKRDPKTISLIEIIKAVDLFDPWNQCVMGLNTCHDKNGCPVHEIWKYAKQRILETFERMSLKDVTKRMYAPRFRELQRVRLNLSGQG